MGALKLSKFGGMLPAWDDRLLPEGQAAVAHNTYLFSGALNGWRKPKLLRALTNPDAAFAYRVPTITRAKATANLLFVTNVNAGDTVKVGEETYTFTATVTDAYDVLLGASKSDSAANLFAAIVQTTGTVGTTYGNGTEPNPVVSTAAGENVLGAALITLTAPDYGSAYNSIPLTESTGRNRIDWVDPTLVFQATTFLGGTNPSFDSAVTGAATWLEFDDPLTDVMRSLTVNDEFNRSYFASSSLPPKYNTYDRILASSAAWLLGIPAVGCAPLVTVTGGGDSDDIGFDVAVNTTDATNAPGSNVLFLVPITPAGAMQLDSVSFMPAEDKETLSYFGVLYSDDAGVPDMLLNVGNQGQGLVTDTAAESVFTNPTGLTGGTRYWVGFITDESVAIYRANDAGATGKTVASVFTNGAPAIAPAMAVAVDWQVWGSVTTQGIYGPRAYVYTYLSEYGEEGPPSPPTLVNGWSNGVWTLTLYEPPPDEMGVTRNLTKKRVYRTIASSSGLATYFYVTELDIDEGTYVDDQTDDVVGLNGQLESTLWFPPPTGLQGIMAMPNGVAVGYKDNELWFCEPYRPHAWPPSYVLTTEFPIVGIGVIGQTVVAATSGKPYIASGAHPASMTLVKVDIAEPCISRRGVLSTATGVFYCSPNGLIRVTEAGQASNSTELWITRERWRELTPSKNVHAILLSSCYFAFGTVNGVDVSVAQDGFAIELSEADAQNFSIFPQPGGHRLGLTTLSAPDDEDIFNVIEDTWSGTGLLIQDGQIFYYDFSDTEPEMETYIWRSKKYHGTFSKNLEAMRAYFTVPTNTPAQAEERDVSATMPTLAADQYGIIRVFADDLLVTTRELRTSGEVLRILSGFKAEAWQFEIEGRVNVSNVQVATTLRELASV